MDKIIKEIDKRRSLRALSDKPVPEDVLKRLIYAATRAPSCFNNQPWRFMVVNEEEALSKVKARLAGGNYWAERASAFIVVSTNIENDCMLPGGRNYALLDTGMAVQNILLQATAEGINAHPIAGFDSESLKEDFGYNSKDVVITVVVLGYPGSSENLSDSHKKAEQEKSPRKPEKEIIAFNIKPPPEDEGGFG